MKNFNVKFQKGLSVPDVAHGITDGKQEISDAYCRILMLSI